MKVKLPDERVNTLKGIVDEQAHIVPAPIQVTLTRLQGWISAWWHWLAVGLIFCFLGLTNSSWWSANVVTLGWDRVGHFERSVRYFHLLRDLSPQALFSIWTLEGYYPPIVHLVAVAAYHMFGLSRDAAAATMLLWLVPFLIAVYAIANDLWGRAVGVLSVAIVSLFPMIYAVSRYFYLDFPLTAMVAGSIALLITSDRFRNRRRSLLFGLSLGVGFLIKWTFIFFVVGPVAVTVLAAVAGDQMLRRYPWQTLRRRFAPARWQDVAFAAVGGLILTALFLGADVERVLQLRLGILLVPLFLALFTLTLYAWRVLDHTWLTNFVAAGLLGVTIAATWALPRIEFLDRGLWVTYGKDHGRMWGFTAYAQALMIEQISPFLSTVAIAALIWLGYRRWRQAGTLKDTIWLDYRHTTLVVWLLVPYIFFSWRTSTIHSRYIMPILPPLAMLIGVALWRIRPTALRAGACIVVLGLGLIQFFALSYDSLEEWRQAALFEIPMLGETNVLAQGYSLQLPATGPTDTQYWIAPSVLERVDEWRRDNGLESAELGLVVDKYQLNDHHIETEIDLHWHELEFSHLSRDNLSGSVYDDLFEADFILLSDPPDQNSSSEAQAAVERILDRPNDLFHTAFTLDQSYPLPDGSRVLLFRTRYPASDRAVLGTDQEAVQALRRPGHDGNTAVLLTHDSLAGRLGMAGGVTAPVFVLDEAQNQHITREFRALRDRFTQVIIVARDSDHLEVVTAAEQNAFTGSSTWYGDLLVIPTGLQSPDGERRTFDVRFGDAITLSATRIESTAAPSTVLPIRLHWEVADPEISPEHLKIFVHLLTSDGELVAQRDMNVPPDFATATSESQVGLWVPDNLPTDTYGVVVGLYDPNTGRRLSVNPTESSLEADSVVVGTVCISVGSQCKENYEQ